MEDENQWQHLLDEQTVLFRKTIQRSVELAGRVADLERELAVWKLAFDKNDEEKVALKKQVARLERGVGSAKDDNPLVLCLIDGDHNIFSRDLVSQGRAGGSQVAQLLTKGITDYLVETDNGVSEPSATHGHAQIWASVYCNKSALQETFTSLGVCTADQFEAFVMGFNQASSSFSLIDVGNDKEAINAKIKECLRVFTKLPQTCKVFFGGGHDNGYASTLKALQNEGLLEKIIILRGYKALASEIKALKITTFEIQGVFLTPKHPVNHSKTTSDSITVESEEKKLHSIVNNSLPSSPSTSTFKTKPTSKLSSSTTKYSPPPCNFFYLSMCKAGSACQYGHAYELDTNELNTLRINAKKSPCAQVNKNLTCPLGAHCPMGHVCPFGAKCKYRKIGKCRFSGLHMHDDSNTSGRGKGKEPATPDFSGFAVEFRTSSPPSSINSRLPLSAGSDSWH